MPGKVLALHPILRILLPFTVGIAVGCRHGSMLLAIAIATCAMCIYVVMRLVANNQRRRYAMQPMWIFPFAGMALATGIAVAVINRPVELDLEHVNGKPVEARVTAINRSDFSTTMTAKLLIDGMPNVQLSTRGCDYTLDEGDYVRFTCDLHPITNQGNPDEMDYAGYMWHKGIRYYQHLTETPFHYKKANEPWNRLYGLRHRLEAKVMSSLHDPIAQQVVIAMLLGDSRIIDKDMREQFSSAGIAHVLALSGLHMGIIVWVIWLLLFPLDYWNLKKLRLSITIIALIAFCALTGFSPSAVRAALMISTSFITYILFRRYSPINALFLAALLILLIEPYQLFNIGFQLSFITMLSLLVSLPAISVNNGNRIVRYLFSTLATSVVAMLATIMLTAYYFHTISFIAPIANLLTLSLVPIVIVLGAMMIITALLGIHIPLVEWLTTASCRAMQWSGTAFAGIEGGSMTNVYVNELTLVIYFIALALIAWWLYNRNKKVLYSAMAAVVALVITHVVTTALTPSKGIVVFNNYKSTPILCFDSGEALLWIPDYDDDAHALQEEFIHQHKAFLAHHGITHLSTATNNDTTMGNMAIKPPFARLLGCHITAIDHRQDAVTASTSAPACHILILGRHFRGDSIPAISPGTIIHTGVPTAPLCNSPVSANAKQHFLSKDGAYVKWL